MTKAALASRVAVDAGLSLTASMRVVEAVLSSLGDVLVEEGRITLVGFGSFVVRERPERRHVTPGRSAPVVAPAYRTVVFKASPALRAALRPAPRRDRP